MKSNEITKLADIKREDVKQSSSNHLGSLEYIQNYLVYKPVDDLLISLILELYSLNEKDNENL